MLFLRSLLTLGLLVQRSTLAAMMLFESAPHALTPHYFNTNEACRHVQAPHTTPDHEAAMHCHA
jgi:hypothetical protein